MIEARLRVIGGNEKEEFQLELPATIGRGRDNSITLRDSLISRQHCRISIHEGSLVVTDLDSLNGTYIGRDKIHGQSDLPPDSLLTVGTVTFRAVGEGGTVIDPEVDPGEKTHPSVNPAEAPLHANAAPDDIA